MTNLDLTKMSAEELTALACEAKRLAKDARSRVNTQLDTFLDSAQGGVEAGLKTFPALRSLLPGTVMIRIDAAGVVTTKWKRGRRVTRRYRVPRPPLVYAYFAKQRTSLSVAAILPKIESAFGTPWPGETPAARRNSLKAALARIRPAEKAVAKLKTPKAIRNWASKQTGAGYRKAAEAMIALSAA